MGWGPEAPDMSGSNRAAEAGAALSQEQWDDYVKNVRPKADQQADRLIGISEDQYALSREGQEFQQGLMKRQDGRYWSSVAPMEDRYMQDAVAFNTQGKRDELSGQALGDVNQAFSSARGQMYRGQLNNPSGGQSAARETMLAIEQAKAQSNAANKTQTAARMEGLGRVTDAIAMNKGMSGFNSQTMLGFGSAAGSAAGMGMGGLTAMQGMTNQTAQGASQGLQSASQNLRANAVESAKNPMFDAMMGLAAGGMQAWGMKR